MRNEITEAMVEAAQGVFTSWGYSASNPECLKAALSAALTQSAEQREPVDHDRALKDALFACVKNGCTDAQYGGVLVADGKYAWVRFSVEPAYTSPPVACPEPVRRVRHKKRGSTYGVIGTAELQMAHAPVFEGSHLTIYRCEEDGKLWAREEQEFDDGRFEEITPALRALIQKDKAE